MSNTEERPGSPVPPGSKKKGKKEKAQPLPPQQVAPELSKGSLVDEGEKGGGDSENGDVLENPYVMVVSKKIRGLRKKMVRIKSLEEHLALGKPLDEEQKVLLSNKPSLERTIKDHEAIRTQLLDVAKDESRVRKTVELGPEDGLEEKGADAAEGRGAASPATVETVKSTEMQTQTQEPELAPQPEPRAATPAPQTEAIYEDAINRLLRLLHVYNRFQERKATAELKGIDLFAKTILGETSPLEQRFDETLAQSVKRALLYLHPTEAQLRKFQNGVTYRQLEERVDELVNVLSPPPEPEEVAGHNGDEDDAHEANEIFFGSLGGEVSEYHQLSMGNGLLQLQHVMGVEQRHEPLESAWTGMVAAPSSSPPRRKAQDTANNAAISPPPLSSVLDPTGAAEAGNNREVIVGVSGGNRDKGGRQQQQLQGQQQQPQGQGQPKPRRPRGPPKEKKAGGQEGAQQGEQQHGGGGRAPQERGGGGGERRPPREPREGGGGRGRGGGGGGGGGGGNAREGGGGGRRGGQGGGSGQKAGGGGGEGGGGGGGGQQQATAVV